MTEGKLAEKYVIDKYGTTTVSASVALQKAYIAGYKAGQPKWHKVADGDLPENSRDVVTNQGILCYCGNGCWRDTQCYEYSGVTVWCEIPKYEEE